MLPSSTVKEQERRLLESLERAIRVPGPKDGAQRARLYDLATLANAMGERRLADVALRIHESPSDERLMADFSQRWSDCMSRRAGVRASSLEA
jgi:hypothetical protein